jgi:hypothetical protein
MYSVTRFGEIRRLGDISLSLAQLLGEKSPKFHLDLH